ncbi:receptor-like protein kinase 2 [Gossypium australe]|uniref:Receptor-like protein kinase 2 n=1 Tax=Gossypium australe TaxID=47621 RepID=A0A5B6VFK0_9ROSI|nr:receptor-like protein kinase 2 [Gossypium australe]
MLRIMDISHNEFIGSLPTRFFKNLKAMLSVGRNELREVQYVGQKDFHSQWNDVVRVTTHVFSFFLIFNGLTWLTITFACLKSLQQSCIPQEILIYPNLFLLISLAMICTFKIFL